MVHSADSHDEMKASEGSWDSGFGFFHAVLTCVRPQCGERLVAAGDWGHGWDEDRFTWLQLRFAWPAILLLNPPLKTPCSVRDSVNERAVLCGLILDRGLMGCVVVSRLFSTISESGRRCQRTAEAEEDFPPTSVSTRSDLRIRSQLRHSKRSSGSAIKAAMATRSVYRM